jgi:hypothetical protein
MAFIDQVQDLTSLTVSDNDELSQFLKDGVIDVTNRCLAVKPQDIEDFTRESSEITSQAGIDLNGAKILSVVREAGTDNDWRACRKIPVSLQSRVTDVDSLHYASKYNPAYMIGNDNKVSVFPTPDSNPEAYKVYYVNNVPVDKSGALLVQSHNDIGYFSDDKVYLVVMYASMKLLQATMGAKTVSTLSITAVPPDTPSAPSFADVTVSTTTARAISASAPTFTAPTVGGANEQLTATIDAATAGEATDKYDYSRWFDLVADYIEDEEDTELAAAQLQKISTYINAYQAEVQTQLNEFNEANVAYQQDVQEALAEMQVAASKAEKDADFTRQKAITEYTNKLQKFQNEISLYQADINSQVQEYAGNIQEVTTEYQWLQAQYAAIKADYDNAFAIMAPRQAQGAR